MKLVIDHKFNPKRDIQSLTDISGLWFMGLAIGSSLTSILAYQQKHQEIVAPVIAEQTLFYEYPYLSTSIVNVICAVLSLIIVQFVFPDLTKKKQLYK